VQEGLICEQLMLGGGERQISKLGDIAVAGLCTQRL
jgi:hypothetical protein